MEAFRSMFVAKKFLEMLKEAISFVSFGVKFFELKKRFRVTSSNSWDINGKEGGGSTGILKRFKRRRVPNVRGGLSKGEERRPR